MKSTQIAPVKSPIYIPSAPKSNCDFITDNIHSVGNKNPIKNFITNLFKTKNTSIINKIKNSFLLKINNIKLKNTKNINTFIDILKDKNIYAENILESAFIDKCLKSRPENLNNLNTLILKEKNYIGDGSYGVAYRVGNFAIKIPKYGQHLEFHYANLDRSKRILTDINQDEDFCRVLTPKNGSQILITKFIDGQSVTGEEAYQFVKSRGRILHDYNVDGNVRKDKQGKLHLIDADFATLPIEARRNSLGSNQLYDLYKNYTNEYLKFKEK